MQTTPGNAPTFTGEMPKLADADNWYACRFTTRSGYGTRWVSRESTDAHGAGRQILAYARNELDPGVSVVEVHEGAYLQHVVARLATVSDPTEPGPIVAQFEKDLEAVRITHQRDLEARQRLEKSIHDAYNRDDLDYLGANEIARRTDGIISRPTVLKLVRATAEEVPEDDPAA